MNFLKEIFSADGLTKIGGLAGGNMASKAVVFQGDKFIADAKAKALVTDPKAENKILDLASKALPVAPAILGCYLSGQKSTLARAIGNGMIAESLGSLIGGLIDKENKLGIGGTGQVFIAGPYVYDNGYKQGAKEPFINGTKSYTGSNEMSY